MSKNRLEDLREIQTAEQFAEAYRRNPVADIRAGTCDPYFSARRAGISHVDAVRETITHTQKPGTGNYK